MALFYLFAIPLIIGGMVLHNGLDFLRKLLRTKPSAHPAHSPGQLRMSLDERIQHLILAATFIVLAYTGFALKYPDAWWTPPSSFAGEGLRRIVHRWAALAFCLLGAYHILYLAASRRGRRVFACLWPAPRDARDVLDRLAYLAWLRPEPPALAKPNSYIEKSEYWALLWGSLVMIATGALLVFSNFTLKHFPLWVPDLATLIHFYEAVLACLAILVWHAYWTVFDPDVYPMSWAWLTGKVRRETAGKDEKL